MLIKHFLRENKSCQNLLLRNLNDKILGWPTFKILTFHLPSKMTAMTINRSFIKWQKEIESAEFFQRQFRSQIENQGSNYRILGVSSFSKLPKQWGWKLWIRFINHIFFLFCFDILLYNSFLLDTGWPLRIFLFIIFSFFSSFFFPNKKKLKVVALIAHLFLV